MTNKILKKNIIPILKKYENKLKINPASFSFSKLGQGENNTPYLIQDESKKVVLRTCNRPANVSIMKHEFETLQEIPDGVGPDPITRDTSKKILDKPFMILSFVDGKPVKQWSTKHLRMHALALARLHKKKYSWFGRFSMRWKKPFFIEKQFRAAKDSFKVHQDINNALAGTEKKVRAYCKRRQPLFNTLDSFSMVHGDCCTDNILFSKNDVRYIDWEWAMVGDPALDVASLSMGAKAIRPWYIGLTKEKFSYYLKEYLGKKPDADFEKRIRVWQVYMTYFTLRYALSVSQGAYGAYNPYPKKVYAEAADLSSEVLMELLK